MTDFLIERLIINLIFIDMMTYLQLVFKFETNSGL